MTIGAGASRWTRVAAVLLATSVLSATGLGLGTTPAQASGGVTLTTTPASPSSSTSPVWTFAATAPTECETTSPIGVESGWVSCVGSYQASLAGPDGAWTFSVRESSPVGAATTVPYLLDTYADLTLVGPPSPRQSDTATWTISDAASDSVLTCTVDGAPSTCASGANAVTGLAEGSHTLAATVVDVLGNTRTVSADYVRDTTAPGAPTVSGPSGTANTSSVRWTWSPESSSDVATCTVTGPGAPSPGGCTSPYDLVLPADGTWSLAVALTDAAGNTGPTGRSPTYLYDGTPPAAPVVTPLTSPAVDRSPTWQVRVDPVGTTSCTLRGATAAAVPCDVLVTDPTTVQVSGVLPSDDTWVLTVRTTDAAGNSAAATTSYELDTHGPLAPVVTGPAGAGKDGSPTWRWSPSAGSEPVASATCTVVRTDVSPATRTAPLPCAGGTFTTSLPTDGSYVAEVVLTDGLGNTGPSGASAPYAYDGTAPLTPVITGPPLLGNDPTPTFRFSPEAGSTSLCRVTPDVTAAGWTRCDTGSYAPRLGGTADYVVEAATTDAVGNVSGTGTRAYRLDVDAPAAAVLTPPTTPGSTRFPSWGIANTGDGVLSCSVVSGTTVVVPSAPCGTSTTVDLTGQPDGAYTLRVVATDLAGNTSAATSTYTLDTTAPAVPTVIGPASPGNSTSPRWTFVLQAGDTASCSLQTGLSLSPTTDCSSGTYTASLLADGDYVLHVRVVDPAGNPAPAVADSAVYTSDRTAPPAPTVTGPSGPGRDASPTWTWVPELRGAGRCRLDKTAGTGAGPGTWTACDSGTVSPATRGDGSYVLLVQLVDQAGNSGGVTTTPSYDLDTVRPVAPVVTGPTGPSNVASPVWSWTGETVPSTQCRLVHDGTAGSFAACTSGQPRGLAGDGSYVLDVRLVDAAGNVSPVGSSPPYAYDGTAPGPARVTAPASPATGRSPSFAWTGETGTTATCRVLRGAALVRDVGTCASPLVVDLTGQPDAGYVLEVVLTDLAGNAAPVAVSSAYLLDTTAPTAPVVTGPAGPSTTTAPSWTFTTSETGLTSTCRLVHDGVQLASAACTSPYAPMLVGDGQWVLRVRATDAAGNVSAAGVSGSYLLDTTAPVAPTVTPPSPVGRDALPSWTVVAEAGTTAECRTATSAGAVVSDWASCTLPPSTDLRSAPDGGYVLAVRLTDQAGLVGPAGSGSYLLDRIPPAVPLFGTQPASPSRSRTASFPFTTDAGTTVTCRLVRGTTTVSPDATCTSPVSLNLTGQPDGAYVLSLRAADAAGNTSPLQTATYVLDTTAPQAPVLTGTPAATAPDRTPTWSFTSETGATAVCRLTGTFVGQVSLVSPCTSPYVGPLTNQPDDTYVFSVTATDAAGNTGPAVSSSYLLDATAPVTPVVSGPRTPGRTTTPTWTLSAPDGTPQCRLTKGSLVVREYATCGTSVTIDLSPTGDGTYVLAVRSVDAAGNLSADVLSRYDLDTVAPAPATLANPPSPGTDRGPNWTISTPETSVTASCALVPSGTILLSSQFGPCAATPAGSSYTADLTGRADGAYDLVVRLVDAAGNVSPDARGSYVLDTSAPGGTTITAPRSPSSLATPTWTLSGDADTVLQCRLTGGTLTSTAFVPCAPTAETPGSASFTADLTRQPDGTFVLSVRAQDAAGNLGPESTSGYEVDRLPPPVPSPPAGPTGPSHDPLVTWTTSVAPGASAACTLSSAALGRLLVQDPCPSPLSVDLGAYGDGTYTLSLVAVDAAGNRSGPASATYVLDTQAPDAPVLLGQTGSPSRDTRPVFSFRGTGGTTLCRLVEQGVAPGELLPCTSPVTYDLGTAVAGSWQLQVLERDAADNDSPLAVSPPYVLDLTAPLAPVVGAPPVSLSPGRTPVFAVSLSPDDHETVSVSCSVLLPGAAEPVPVDGCGAVPFSSAVEVTLAAGLQDGPVVLKAVGTDAVGNTSATSAATYTLDATPPATPVLTAPDPASSRTSSTTWSWAGPVDAVSWTCQLRRDGELVPVLSAPCASPFTTALTAWGPGLFTLSVLAVDQAGNTSALAASADYRWEPPVPVVAAPRGPVSGTDLTPTWTFTVPAGYTASCLVSRDGVALQAERECTSPFTPDLVDQPTGTYGLAVRLHDAYGNVGSYSRASYRLLSSAAPTGVGIVVPPPVSPPLPPGSPGTRPPPPSSLTPVVTPVGPPVRPGTVPAGTVAPGTVGPTAAVPRPAGGLAVDLPRPRPHDNGVIPTTIRRVGKAIVDSLPFTPSLDVPVRQAIRDVVTGIARRPALPLALLLVVVLFLLVQNRIDHRDPKLARAPVEAEPELGFGPAVRRLDWPDLGGASA